MAGAAALVTVFADGPGGGNPAPIVLDAAGWSDARMQALARGSGHESAFVVDPSGTGCDVALRFWVPNHEMSMCGHATVGALWLMRRRGLLPDRDEVRVHTAAGPVRGRLTAEGAVRVSQPVGTVQAVPDPARALAALGGPAVVGGVRNAATTRVKTIVDVGDAAVLDALMPDYAAVESACAAIDSTGLYPYARTGERQFDARQFPRSSGYPEDPATGIAAAALVCALVAEGTIAAGGGPVVVRQGRAMGRPSRITVWVGGADPVCWLGGAVELG